MSSNQKIVIVGGGPAGVATSVALSRAGRKVVLYEVRSFKQSQLSDLGAGEVLSPGAQRELARLGFPCEAKATWRMEDFSVLHQFWTPTRTTSHRLPDQLCYWQIDRGQFDRALLDFAAQIGVEIHLGHRVKGPLRHPVDGYINGICLQTPVETTVEARLVVDAAGRHSPLLSRLNLKQPESEFQRFATICFFSYVPETVTGVWEQHFLGAGNTTLNGSRMRPDLYRYTLETDLSRRAEFAGLHRPLDLFLAMLEATRPSLAARFRAAIPLSYATAFAPVGYKVDRPVLPGLLMVGDAAGYLDPATGQGIEFALRTARLATTAILKTPLPQSSYSPLELGDYEVGLSREIERAKRTLRLYLRLTRHKLLIQFFSYSRLLRAMLIRRLVKPRR